MRNALHGLAGRKQMGWGAFTGLEKVTPTLAMTEERTLTVVLEQGAAALTKGCLHLVTKATAISEIAAVQTGPSFSPILDKNRIVETA